MTPAELAAYLGARSVRGSYVMPAIGVTTPAVPATKFVANGNKMACVVAGQPYAVIGIFVRDIIALDPAKSIRVVCDHAFPEQAIDFEVIPPVDRAGTDDFMAFLNGIDEIEDEVDALRAEKLAAVPDYPDPELNTPIKFVRWSRLEPVIGIVAAGVITYSADGSRLLVAPFPGYEVAATSWNERFDGNPPPPLDELPDWAGRQTFITHPETIKGESYDDAVLRALHKFGAEVYRETGRSAFA